MENALALYPGAKFYVADISYPSFQSDPQESEFDSILCINVLEHVKEDRVGITNMFGKLKKGYFNSLRALR
ncbi:class I SAM-dependent methyltransferase [Nitrospinae bacterium]|nr:class I SAM-dependent methyltransferase [Nitrospinota bacterium]